jgi:glutathione S-transferase
MKLIASLTSPYARKVRVLLAEKKLPFELVVDNPWAADAKVPAINPIGKVPALVTDDGMNLFDSRVIAEYLDERAAPRFIPAAGTERLRVRCDEALADGMTDAGIAMFLERKREAARQDPAWLERQRGKVDAGVKALAAELGDKPFLRGTGMTLGDVAAACGLLWVEFRLPEVAWREGYPGLARWIGALESRDSFAATQPPR